MSSEYTGLEIAIIGMSGRFPGSKNVKELWNNLCEGKNLISYFSEEELLKNNIPEEYIKDKNYVKARGILEDVDKFDADLFGFYPKEIENLDPQQRLFLECSWEALEDAGYQPDNIDGLTGVFGGIGMNTYVLQFLKSNPELTTSAEGYQFSIGNEKDFLTTRVSYKLNLKGPSLDLQTACSTSLVATHLACMNLLNFQCDVALAGGSTISLPQVNGYHYQEGMILSPDGVCRPFDKDAGGTVAGNGVGIVVLKRLEDAINDKDEIYAIIKGSAYNNDGAIKVGYTAPGVNGQVEVITSAYANAEVPMSSIGYIETHGTGTSLGDPIEIDALTQAFSQDSDKKQFCAIGSVKSNVGHLDTAAGVTGLIKAALSVYYGKIPPSINFNSPNPKINFNETPFYVNTELREWKTTDVPRRAGVSSFGIGGTNVHIVLEEPPKKEIINEDDDEYRIVPFSANTKNSLKNITENFKEYLKDNSDIDFTSIAFTLQNGRKEFAYRQFLIADSTNQVSKILNGEIKQKLFANNGKVLENPSVVFMFSGQGSQYINMTKELYDKNANYRKYVNECFDVLEKEENLNLKEIIFPNSNSKEATEKLKQTEYTQPALFVIEYSLAKLFMDSGIVPHKMVGHSIGEYTAACLSGVMDLRAALKLVTARGKLMQKLEKGSMLSVTLSEQELKEILPDDIDLAVINSPELCVVSGEPEKINKFEELLNTKEISSAFLHTSHAFHSRMMEPVLEEFKSVVENINLNAPVIPYMSNVTGNFITNDEAVNPNYYVNHLRYTVRFADNVSNLLKDENIILIEIGPGSTLTSLAKLNHQASGRTIINTVKHPKQSLNDEEILLNAIGNLWLSGVKIDWMKFYTNQPPRIHLPTYAFDKKRYWISVGKSKFNQHKRNPNRNNVENWFYEISWKRKSLVLSENIFSNILIFENRTNPIAEYFDKNNRNIFKVFLGAKYKQINDNIFEISNTLNDYQQLFDKLNEIKFIPEKIIHNWTNKKIRDEDFNEHQKCGFLSLMNLAKTILNKNIEDDILLDIITSNIFDITGYENIIPSKATIIGAAKVINQEVKNIRTKIIDIKNDDKENKENLINEICSGENQIAVALRGKYRWVNILEELSIGKDKNNLLLRENGVYLITGGLGRIGLTFAQHLAENYKAKIVLIDRFEIPPKEEWEKYIQDNDDSITPRIKNLISISEKGTEVLVLKADVEKENELRTAIETVIKKFKKINGIIHAAGLVGNDTVNLISDFSEENFIKQSSPKIKGTINLAAVLDGVDLDFVMIQSSLASVLGGLGFASYSAVNNFIDAFVTMKAKKNYIKWISLNWDAWNFNSSNEKGITPLQGNEILDTVIRKDSPNQIVISIDDIHESIDKWLLHANNEEDELEENTDKLLHERPDLDVEYIEPSTELENKIFEEWQKLLGIEKIGINDNFFDLGGDSLIGTQLVSRMRKTFSVDIPLVAIFENATIKGIADLIEKNSTDKNETDEIASLLNELENLSEEEVQKKLNDKNKG